MTHLFHVTRSRYNEVCAAPLERSYFLLLCAVNANLTGGPAHGDEVFPAAVSNYGDGLSSQNLSQPQFQSPSRAREMVLSFPEYLKIIL